MKTTVCACVCVCELIQGQKRGKKKVSCQLIIIYVQRHPVASASPVYAERGGEKRREKKLYTHIK